MTKYTPELTAAYSNSIHQCSSKAVMAQSHQKHDSQARGACEPEVSSGEARAGQGRTGAAADQSKASAQGQMDEAGQGQSRGRARQGPHLSDKLFIPLDVQGFTMHLTLAHVLHGWHLQDSTLLLLAQPAKTLQLQLLLASLHAHHGNTTATELTVLHAKGLMILISINRTRPCFEILSELPYIIRYVQVLVSIDHTG